MILSVSGISKTFVDKTVLENISFHLEDYDKVALIGINGAGKTTLLRIIMGEYSADQGLVTLAKGKTVGYLSQNPTIEGNCSIYEGLMQVKSDLIAKENKLRELENSLQHYSGQDLEEKMNLYATLSQEFERDGGYLYKSEVNGVLKGLGFIEEEFSKPMHTLSGGQKTRIALGQLLLTKPDLIILDEPTNHLDMHSIAWLENYLLNYKGAVLVVSHDRYFLDKIAGKVIEIDQGKATVFTGNYTDYSKKKEILRVSKLNAYLNQQKEIKHQEEVIEKLRSFNREKSIKRAESREKVLQKMDVLDKPMEVNSEMKLQLTPRFISGNDVLSIQGLSKSFPNQILFENVDIDIKRGEHVAIIGDNGTGKTTLLKIINGLVDGDEGTIKLGTNVTLGYYDQEHQVLHTEKTLFEEISDQYPTLTNTEIRNTLAAFLFTGEDVFKKISTLSGGEQGRLALAKLMLSESNFLILDEPTNHLDIDSREILEGAVNHYEGTLLYVSHDRYFINKTASRILDLRDQCFTNYLGNYDYYLEKHGEEEIASLTLTKEASVSNIVKTESESKLDWKQQKEEAAALRKKEAELKKVETSIEKKETRLSEIEAEMCDSANATNVGKLQALQKEKETLEAELETLMEQWEVLSE
ncbi:MAG: ABC-F family ATP-binding cassette domain-containing protein [Lachnospiraceae bacterium]|nr:ABC-F family ATP-binding cassette domain-containing protein [Lachnospiraceae bacterium]